MFPDFLTTIQEDARNICRAISNFGFDLKIPLEERAVFGAEVSRAIARAFGLLAMAFASFFAVRASFSFRASPVSSLITIAACAATFALGHDVFVIFKKWSDWQLDKEPQPPQPFFLSSAKDTFYRPLWEDGMHRMFGWL